MDVDSHLAKRVLSLRKDRRLSLDQLAELSGVSRSMISLIERAQTSPSAAVLNRLADALGVSLASLFVADSGNGRANPLSSAAQQPTWSDPDSGYTRRYVSPVGVNSPIELMEVTFPPGKAVSFESPIRSARVHQLVWILEGEMDVTVGTKKWHLTPGDCLAMELDEHVVFRNPTRKTARYAVALTSAATSHNRRVT